MKYNRQEVIEKATNLFWEKGFHATSMRNLQEVIDMRPGSIYAGFGSKEGLFSEALKYYSDAGLKKLAACIDNSPSPLEALKSFIRGGMTCSSTAPSGMCMLVKSLAELTDENPKLLAQSKQLLGDFEDAFAAALKKAQDCGEIDPSKNTQQLAKVLQIQLMGLRTYSQARGGDIPVEELLEDALSFLK